jgi:spermidine synthase
MNRHSISSRLLLAAVLAACLIWPALAQQEGRIVYEVQSKFQKITVWDSPDGIRRQLIFDADWSNNVFNAIQSEVNKRKTNELILTYAQYMITSLPVVEKPKHILVVGLGGACIQRYLHNLLPDAVIETAELDPAVLDVAKRYFYLTLDDRQKVTIGDGRKFIEQSKDKYDIIMLDAFSATSIPYMLATQEFLKTVKDHLAVGGVVCANLWYNQADYRDMLKTYDSVFAEWHVMRCPNWGNAILLGLPTKQNLTPEKWIEKCKAFEKAYPATGMPISRFIDHDIEPVTRVPADAIILLDKDAGKHK